MMKIHGHFDTSFGPGNFTLHNDKGAVVRIGNGKDITVWTISRVEYCGGIHMKGGDGHYSPEHSFIERADKKDIDWKSPTRDRIKEALSVGFQTYMLARRNKDVRDMARALTLREERDSIQSKVNAAEKALQDAKDHLVAWNQSHAAEIEQLRHDGCSIDDIPEEDVEVK